jgi:hypothetical protein
MKNFLEKEFGIKNTKEKGSVEKVERVASQVLSEKTKISSHEFSTEDYFSFRIRPKTPDNKPEANFFGFYSQKQSNN